MNHAGPKYPNTFPSFPAPLKLSADQRFALLLYPFSVYVFVCEIHLLIRGSISIFPSTIDGIGTIKAAYMTKATAKDKDGKDKDYGVIAAAFDLTIVDGLYASVGAQIPTAHVFTSLDIDLKNPMNPKVTASDVPTVVNAYARYSLDALAVHLAVGTKLNTFDVKKAMKGDDAALDGQVGFAIGAGADYSLDNGIGFFGDVRYANGIYMANTSADKSDCLTFGLGVEKNFSNGKIGIAFEGATNGNGRYTYEDNAFAWEIPVKVEYFF